MNTSVNTQVNRSETARRPAGADYALLPAVDIIEDQTGITLTADVPGVSKDNLNVRVEGGHLLIDAGISISVPDDLNVLHAEVRGGSYHRSFALSSELDTAAVEASLKDGVLTIRVPRTDRAKPRRIEVRS
ncbi:MAG: heat shock protein Hsp20 [Betaproteobacteria bacterium]|nr:heat shock protein Hsp20 [Betaproteobacteria bacterium]